MSEVDHTTQQIKNFVLCQEPLIIGNIFLIAVFPKVFLIATNNSSFLKVHLRQKQLKNVWNENIFVYPIYQSDNNWSRSKVPNSCKL